jgi:hypothetical protein
MPESPQLLACRTLPGAPKVIWGRRRAGKAAGLAGAKVRGRQYRPPRGILERLMERSVMWHGSCEVPEELLETDPDFPPSQVRLWEHPRGMEWCREQVRAWREAGFLPVAVSRLVGLCQEDCDRLTQRDPAEFMEDHDASPYTNRRQRNRPDPNAIDAVTLQHPTNNEATV